MIYYAKVQSPIGQLTLCGDGQALTGLYFSSGSKARGADPAWAEKPEYFSGVSKQLEEYFAGVRQQFDLQLKPHSTPFQGQVLAALQTIPYGEVCSYKDIAVQIGNPKAVRAVGTANGNNPIAIIIPCHRVIGSDGTLTGFGGGLEVKRQLLALEKNQTGLFASQ